MAELTIDPATIRKALDDFVESYKPSDTPTQEVGYVATAGDGIAHVTGLPGCMANELLTFEDGTLGLAFNLDAREIGVLSSAISQASRKARRSDAPAKCSPCPSATAISAAPWTRWATRSMVWVKSRALKGVESSKPRLLTLCTVIPSTNRCPPA